MHKQNDFIPQKVLRPAPEVITTLEGRIMRLERKIETLTKSVDNISVQIINRVIERLDEYFYTE